MITTAAPDHEDHADSPYGIPFDGGNDTVPVSSVKLDADIVTVSKWYFDTGGNLCIEHDEGASR